MSESIAFGGLRRNHRNIFRWSQHLDTIGKPETLYQRYESWKMDLEIYITAIGVWNAEQKKVVLLLTGEEGLREIWRNFIEKRWNKRQQVLEK